MMWAGAPGTGFCNSLFTQADSTATRTHEGLGIGLCLAKRIMGAHGGRIGLTPRAGGGSTFVLAFPRFPSPGAS